MCAMFVSAILAAAGRGTRLGSATPKQMLTLGERTILQRSFDIVEAHDEIDEIVIALPPDLASVAAAVSDFFAQAGAHRRWRHAAAGFGGERVRTGVEKRRASSSFTTPRGRSRRRTCLRASSRRRQEEARRLRRCRRSDTVKEATAAPGVTIVARTIARESIYLAQTPQAFSREVLEDAIALGRESHRSPRPTKRRSPRRPATPCRLVDGESTNIKITTEHDLRRVKSASRDSGFGIGDSRSAADRNRLRPASP